MVAGHLPYRRPAAVGLAVAAALCALLGVVHDHDWLTLPVAGKTAMQSSERSAGPSACTACRLSQLQALAPQAPDHAVAFLDDVQPIPPPPAVPRTVFLGPLSPRAPPAKHVATA